MKKYTSILMLLFVAALSTACDENAVTDISEPSTGALVKFFHFAPGGPGVNFYANDTKITAISSTTCAILTDANREQCTTSGAESTTGVTYSGAGNGASGWYSDIAPGQYTFTARIAATTDKDLPITTLQTSIVAGKRYSFYLSGAYNTTAKTAESFIIEDNLPEVDYTMAYVRFVNAVSTSTGAMTLYAKDQATSIEVPIGGAVAYKAGGEFVAIPPATYDLATRYGGASTNAISRTGVSFAAGRIYTITGRGTTSLALDNTANR